jgi:polyhydroxybutyrate depolymerase
VVEDVARRMTATFGAPRAAVLASLGFLGLLVATWKQLVQGLAIGLTGNPRLVRTSALLLALSFHVRNRNNGTLVVGSGTREYLLHVPARREPSRWPQGMPLVVSLHGGALWPAAQRDLSRWNEVADEHGFLVVYPSGVSGRGPRAWHMDPAGLAADVEFIARLLDRLQAEYPIDRRRIYADGLSNGGGMAFVLSCKLSDRIAAVGMVASAQLLPWSACQDDRPVPMIAFHGTKDRLAPYDGGATPVVAHVTLPPTLQWTANWARRNRCAEPPAATRVANDVTRLESTACANDATVVLDTIEDGGHTWPGGGAQPEWFAGRTSRSVDATREEWRFFEAHPRAQTATPETPPTPD